MAGGARGCTVACAVLPHRLHFAARTLRSDPPEQAAALRSALPHQRRFVARTCARSQAPGSGHRIPRCAPYLGTEPPDSSHVHYIVPAGGLALPGSNGVASSRRFLLPVEALSHVFRRKFCEELRGLFEQDRLQFHNSLEQLAPPGAFSHFLWQLGQKDWVVYAKPPFGGAEHVLNYLARYTHRVAISNHRLVGFENDRVSFRWRDYAHGGKKKVMTVSADEFLRRFLLHVLPKGLVRIRHFGFFANRRRETALA